MSIKTRLAKLEGRLPAREPDPEPLTAETLYQRIKALFERAAANPGDEALQRRAQAVNGFLDILRERRRKHLLNGGEP